MRPEKTIPRAAALHDLSCFGRCALTVIIPTLSAMGVQCVPVPTALLSTHTGGFSGMYFRETDEEIPRIADHFDEIGLHFDAVYTGFLGSERQADIIADFIRRFGESDGKGGTPTVLVDPVLGDDGELYHTCTPALTAAMTRLCAAADVITPNITEACLMCGIDPAAAFAEAEGDPAGVAHRLSDRLFELAGGRRLRTVVITGIHCRGGIATVTRDLSCCDDVSVFIQPRVGRDYPGTGDIFASVLLGGLLSGATTAQAAEDASRFSALCAERTASLCPDEPVRDGVALEPLLGVLATGRFRDKK